MKSLDEIARFLNGLALQKYPPATTDALPVIKIAHFELATPTWMPTGSADLDPRIRRSEMATSCARGPVSLSARVWAGGLRCRLYRTLFKVYIGDLSAHGFAILGIRQRLD